LHFDVIGYSKSYLCPGLDPVATGGDGSFAANFTGSWAGVSKLAVIFKEKQYVSYVITSTALGKASLFCTFLPENTRL